MTFFRIMLALLLFWSTNGWSEDIILGSGDWCPYVCDPALHDGRLGYLPDIAKIILERAGHRVIFRFEPFARVVLDARSGRLAGIPGVYRGDVPDFVFPAHPQGAGVNTFYVRQDSTWRFHGPSSLPALRSLGIIRDYYYGESVQSFMQQFPNKIDVMYGDAPQQRSLQRLLIGRTDAWIEDNQVANYNIARMNLKGRIVPAGTTEAALPVYIAFSPALPNAQEYARMIDLGVADMRRSGELQGILASYGLTDWNDQH